MSDPGGIGLLDGKRWRILRPTLNRPKTNTMDDQAESNPLTSVPAEAAPPKQAGRLTRVLRPRKRRFLLPICGALILGLDWVLFSSNLLVAGLATPVIAVIGFALGSLGTFLLQSRFAADPWWKAALKALFAGVVVGAPWPIGGTLIGGWVLLFSGLGEAKEDMLRP
jgi:hypothetical protein